MHSEGTTGGMQGRNKPRYIIYTDNGYISLIVKEDVANGWEQGNLRDSCRSGTTGRQSSNHPSQPSRPARAITTSGKSLLFLLGQGPTQVFDVIETDITILQTSLLMCILGVEGLGLRERRRGSTEGSTTEGVDGLC